MKCTAKERKEFGKDKVKESFVKYKEFNKETDGGKERIKEVKKMCKEMSKSKKASEGGKTKAAAKNGD